MDQRSPTVYRTKSWRSRRRVVTVAGAAALLLAGYLLGRWQDTPAEPVISTPAAATAAPPAQAPPSAAPSASPEATAIRYAVLQAESATELSGVETEKTDDEGGGENVGWVNRDDYLRFDNFDFGAVAATKAEIRMSSGARITGRVQIRLDSRDAAPVGELSVSNTGSWQSWQTGTAVLQPVTGTHTVFLTFTSDEDDEFVNINWLRFEH
ncbi:carbohydrate-binding protein [Actinoplanes sp. NEAU-A12]|uniref:Carbohydrate-binding protein n=1 Tax=Actinoplanes sandaracinus TaxID=3045177 RepID=A0ABT6WNM0_9ACTN|nr:carbohydrate-binding protein [Actinoplanes sandaracinus]MDI6101333.1 carbohydrate-binding protein [Actinoplanes sandaracinus]